VERRDDQFVRRRSGGTQREHWTPEAGHAGKRLAASRRVSVPTVIAGARRLIRSVRILARDRRIPKPLRGLAAFGVLPIPGPLDEAALLVVGVILWALYRDTLREAWSQAAL
jgi:hypothetical protein